MMDAAIHDLQLYCETNPHDQQAHYLQSILLFKANHFGEAILVADKVIASGAGSPTVYSVLIHALRVTGSKRCIDAGAECVKLFPDSAECYHELGLSYVANASHDAAESCFRTACELNPRNPDYQLNYAITLMSLKKYSEALVALSCISDDFPNIGYVLYYRGLCLGYEDDFSAAFQALEEARQSGFSPQIIHATIAKLQFREHGATPALLEYMKSGLAEGIREEEFLELYGEVLYQLHCFSELIGFAESLSIAEQDSVRLQNLIGLAYMELELLSDAEAHYYKCIHSFPNDPSAWINLSLLQEKRGDTAAAISSLRAALSVSPTHTEAIFNLASLQLYSNSHEAELLLRRVIDLDPSHGKAYNHLGIICMQQDRYGDARNYFDLALQYQGDTAEILNNIGLLAYQRREYADSEKLLRMAIQKDPENREIHRNLAFSLLVQGKFCEGWNEYAWRLKDGAMKEKFCPLPEKSMIMPGMNLFVIPEQGLGDTIQFIRYFRDLQNLGATVQFACPQELRQLVQLSEWNHTLPSSGDRTTAVTEYDMTLSLLSIPGMFIQTTEDIRHTASYLKADTETVQRFKTRTDPESLNCGIAWQGNKTHKNDHRRSMKLEEMFPLFQVEGVKFHSVQKEIDGNAAEILKMYSNVQVFPPELKDIAETAALIMNLDVLVTVDTMVAHLAGALGKKVLLLLPYAPDWRWDCTGLTTGWYSEIELFRQVQPGDWSSPVAEAGKRLSGLVNQRRNALP